jgi:mono/diheme cytochrome c family protein
MSRVSLLAAVIAASALAGCEVRSGNQAEQTKSPPPAAFAPFEKAQGPDVTNDRVRLAAEQNGERMFQRRCGVCHLEGGMGGRWCWRGGCRPSRRLQDRRDPPELVTTVAKAWAQCPG